MESIEIVPATYDVLASFYQKPIPRTVRAVAAIRGKEILGISGVYVYRDRLVMFADLTDELRKHKRAIVKGMRAVIRIALRYKLPVFAEADADIKGSESLLEHMGFAHSYQRVYEWQH